MTKNSFIAEVTLKEAKTEIIKMVQAIKFTPEIKSVRPRDCSSDGESRIKGNSKISQLDPFWMKMVCLMLEADYTSHI